ncbi:hypothetical protein HNR12_000427 [Streptomonospora nanhaiensis]|uniref:Uncharacterized protein n=1 Tax=Streptomonospora nanhaiensis TaxID=1323731 RepID=A0A853BGJ2_9ACTN|nr:hypothetical protein [Streptomonospora nanhaiensis]
MHRGPPPGPPVRCPSLSPEGAGGGGGPAPVRTRNAPIPAAARERGRRGAGRAADPRFVGHGRGRPSARWRGRPQSRPRVWRGGDAGAAGGTGRSRIRARRRPTCPRCGRRPPVHRPPTGRCPAGGGARGGAGGRLNRSPLPEVRGGGSLAEVAPAERFGGDRPARPAAFPADPPKVPVVAELEQAVVAAWLAALDRGGVERRGRPVRIRCRGRRGWAVPYPPERSRRGSRRAGRRCPGRRAGSAGPLRGPATACRGRGAPGRRTGCARSLSGPRIPQSESGPGECRDPDAGSLTDVRGAEGVQGGVCFRSSHAGMRPLAGDAQARRRSALPRLVPSAQRRRGTAPAIPAPLPSPTAR